jgi:hypothetical protein
MLKYIAALALVLGIAGGAAHCGHPNPHHHGVAATAPELPAA